MSSLSCSRTFDAYAQQFADGSALKGSTPSIRGCQLAVETRVRGQPHRELARMWQQFGHVDSDHVTVKDHPFAGYPDVLNVSR